MKYLTLTVGDSTMRAELNETMAAKDLENRVSFTVSGQRSDVDYCCPLKKVILTPMKNRGGGKITISTFQMAGLLPFLLEPKPQRIIRVK